MQKLTVTWGTSASRQAAGFETHYSIIVNQQLSAQASRAIAKRTIKLRPAIPLEALLSAETLVLRNASLSFYKIEYAKGLAEAAHSGVIDIDSLETMSDEEAIAELTKLSGFGRWSAEIYLISSLGRQDIFPANDLPLQIALQRLKNFSARPSGKQAHKLPRELYKSLYWYRGKEMADHKRFTLVTDIQVYFCDPHNPWQRGSNENTNGLLRQYIPEAMDL